MARGTGWTTGVGRSTPTPPRPRIQKTCDPQNRAYYMSRYTVYVERDIHVECKSDRDAQELAQRIHEAIDGAVAQAAPGVEAYARSTCHRGVNHKRVFDEEHTPAVAVWDDV